MHHAEAEPLNLHVDTVKLARRFFTEADRLDTIFFATADDRAIQGGAVCEDAALHRAFGRKLMALASEMEMS